MLSSVLKRSARKAVISRGFAAKEIKFGVDGRAAMLTGVDTLADAVQVRDIFLVYDSTSLCCRMSALTVLSRLYRA